jgi:hypothetical protein
MYTIELFKIYLFTYLCCLFIRVFLENLVPTYPVAHFESSFKPINGFNWETSVINLELVIKLYSIYLIAKIPNSTVTNVLIHIGLLESTLLATSNSSSFVLHGLISLAVYLILKSLNEQNLI